MLVYKIKQLLLYVFTFRWLFFWKNWIWYLRDLFRFRKQNDGRFAMPLKDLFPTLHDKTSNTPFDRHYTYHPAWAARIVAETRPAYHVDISSILSFCTMVSAFVPVKFYDYRPAKVNLSNLDSEHADLTKLHFADNSIPSLSCMHTIEHIGLGRYGDPIDPKGDLKAISELKRVVAQGGNLLFVTPISGEARIQFNAHRVYSYDMIVKLFEGFTLKKFSLITDYKFEEGFIENATKTEADQQTYGCGCFWFQKA